jgi:hypothetical protein
VVGVPLTETSFQAALQDPGREFVARHMMRYAYPYEAYFNKIIKPANLVLSRLSELQITVTRESYLEVLRSLFATPFKYDVIILFSHWREGNKQYPAGIELIDGFASAEIVASMIPSSFSGVIDLSACHPKGLRDAIHEKAPNCVVGSVSTSITPHFWLYTYQELFERLRARPVPYMDAFEKLVHDMVREAAYIPE